MRAEDGNEEPSHVASSASMARRARAAAPGGTSYRARRSDVMITGS